MRLFSVAPTFRMRGRKAKGLRGWAGKPLHPPLTDVPVTAYLFAGVFDAISFFAGGDKGWSHDLYRAATYVLVGGAAVSLVTALTGLADWWGSTQKGTQAWRTANAHLLAMVTVTLLVVVDLVVRLTGDRPDAHSSPGLPTALSVVAALLVSLGAALGGALVYEYGFNVETAGDHPAWHESETDVLHGEKG